MDELLPVSEEAFACYHKAIKVLKESGADF
jgi:hypothetical protein